MLSDVFSEMKIEYFAVLPISECRVVKPHLLKRLDFEPKCVIFYLLPYYVGGARRVSEYAAARDYHILLSEVGGAVCGRLSLMGASGHSFGDHSPFDERDAAARGGLGILGKNGLLINEKYGTYVFIGEVLTDAELPLTPLLSEARTCSACGKCRAACPKSVTGECLSAITQKKGELSATECELIRRFDTVWGCDICQKVCPHNLGAARTPLDFFLHERIDAPTLRDIEKMSDEEFSRRAYSWRGRDVIVRNFKILDEE